MQPLLPIKKGQQEALLVQSRSVTIRIHQTPIGYQTWMCHVGFGDFFFNLKCFFLFKFYFLCLSVLPPGMSVQHICVWCLRKSGGHRIPWNCS